MIGLFTTKQAFRYALMPEFTSRLKNLGGGGFHFVAYLMAIVYNMVRLLPDNHPYLDGRNINRFGLRHVIAEAGNNLVISRNTIDQVLLFVIILLGMGLLGLQIVILAFSLFMQPALALGWNDYFVVPPAEATQDIAYIMLDLVFGVPTTASLVPPPVSNSFFGSCVGSLIAPCLDSYGQMIPDTDFTKVTAAGVGGLPAADQIGPISSGSGAVYPFPIHIAMQRLFGAYNMGLLFVAMVITSYFVVTVLAETAQSGTPFGKRYNKLWAPIRIVIAFGLLVPLMFGGNAGMNSSQYIVLYAAKYGSAFATNGWKNFNTTLSTNYRIELNRLISNPTPPEIEHISLFMWLVNVCYHTVTMQVPAGLPGAVAVNAYIIGRQDRDPPSRPLMGASYAQAMDWLDPYPKMIVIRFGEYNSAKYPKEDGFVKPICGEIQIPLTDARRDGSTPPPALGPRIIQEYYYRLIQMMWEEDVSPASPYLVGPPLAVPPLSTELRSVAFAYNGINNVYQAGANEPLTTQYVSAVNNAIIESLKLAITSAVAGQSSPAETSWLGGPCAQGPTSTLAGKGWGAAGIWYNCIAELNGSVTAATMATPTPTRLPEVMENVAAIKAQYNPKNTGVDFFSPTVSGTGDAAIQLKYDLSVQAAQILYEAHRAWIAGSVKNTQNVTSSPFTQAISTFLGTNGLYDMRQNRDVHPLAQLVGLGRGLVEAAGRKMAYALGASAVARALGGADGGLTATAANMLVTIAMLGLTAGFVLAYIVPFLPFIYFFFALGGWVKGVFEAMIGAPLWALAHIRIDGHGLSGNAAMNGYFLIFEIFVRPILTVFGLIASVSIFAALVSALNGMFDDVVYNVSGFNIDQELTGPAADSVADSMRGVIDEFFFTIIYAVICYMMAMSSFKLIDQIPNQILRWMGQSVATFGDTREDPAQALMSRAGAGAQQAFSRMGAGMGGVVSAISKGGK